ncbi:MAG: nucleoside/nucleotide kinase family protein [Selenomonadaceae bacterium]|nr:nucleoside/nucleotide kinase family protein [Selenomonadaceae bacterium]
MSDKQWTTYTMEVNGFEYEAQFSDEAVNNVFLPFIKKLTDIYGQVGRKIIAYLVAPPAVGKSTVSQFIEKLSREHVEYTNIRALGLDGFHFSNAYMDAHFAVIDGSTIPMKMVKGAPETFDLDILQEKIREVRLEGTKWPLYDRIIHDVVPDAIDVEDEIILIEGNYLLLKNPRWTNIRAMADYTVFIKADPELLKHRLIERKIKGGKTQNEAEHFYNTSDSKNVELVLNNSAEPDEIWILQSDGDYVKDDDE